MRVLVSGMVAGEPGQGGAAWAVLQYLLGLRRLGHEVVFAEPVERIEPASLAYLEAVAAEFGLDQVALLAADGESAPLPRERLLALAHDLDVVRTAAALHLHPNSLRYRLARVEKLLGRSLKQPSTIAGLYIAILASPEA